MFGQNPARFDCFVFAVDERFTENPHSEFDSFAVVQQKAVFEMGASGFARIQKAVDCDVILPLAAVSFLTDLRVLKRFHILWSFACRFFLLRLAG